MRRANDLAARVQRTWLVASGLATEIDDLRFQPEGRIVPAPGLERLRLAADETAAQAHELAERIGILVREDLDGVEAAHGELVGVADKAARAARRLAQLGMGVSAATMGGDRIERLDRACVAVLRLEGPVVGMDDEDLALAGTTRDEAQVELAGIVCRVLVDRAPAVRVEVPTAWATLAVDDRDTLIGAWKVSDGEAEHRRWNTPVFVSEPVSVVLDLLLGTGASIGDFALTAE